MNANTTNANTSYDEEKPKSKKILMVIALLVLLGGGGAGAYFTGALDDLITPKQKVEKIADKEMKSEIAKNDTAPKISYHELPEFVANLNPGSATPSFIKMAITVEMASPELVIRLQAVQPKIMDVVNTYLRELRPSDLKGSAGVHRLREELTSRFNKILYPDKINNVLFKELLIQ